DGVTQLYGLYRRQRLLVPILTAGIAPLPTGYEEMSTFNSNGAFNNSATLTIPSRRFGMDPNTFYPSDNGLAPTYPNLYPALSGSKQNDDLLLNDVISFDVRL